jgi:hypothetical protein
MHGGAHGSGGPAGKGNGRYRHGGRSQETVALRREVSAWARAARSDALAILDD